jgi:hypothetical protein
VAIFNIVLGGLGVLAALIILIFFGGLAGIESMQPNLDSELEAAVLGLIGGVAFFIVAILSAPSQIAGIGLLNFRPWARTLTIDVSESTQTPEAKGAKEQRGRGAKGRYLHRPLPLGPFDPLPLV